MDTNKIDSHELAHLLKMREQVKMAQVAHDSHMLYLQAKYGIRDGDGINLETGEIKRAPEKKDE